MERVRWSAVTPPPSVLMGGLLALLVAMIVIVGLTIVGPGTAFSLSGIEPLALVVGLIVAGTALAGLWAVSVGRSSPSSDRPRTRRRLVIDAALRLAPVLVIASETLLDTPLTLHPAARILVRAVIWGSLGAALVLSVHPRTARSPRLQGVLALLAMGMLLVVTVAISVLRSVHFGVLSLVWPLGVMAAAAFVVVPTLLIWGAVDGLAVTEARGARLWSAVESRRWAVFLPLAANLAIVGLLVGVARVVQPDEPLIRVGVAPWTFAVIAAGVLLLVLTLDHRLVVTREDQAVFGRIVTAMFSFPLGLVISILLLPQFFRSRVLPMTGIGLLIVMTVVVTLGGWVAWRRGVRIRFVLAGGAVIGTLASLLILAIPRDPQTTVTYAASSEVIQVIILAGICLVLLGTIVGSLIARRPRLLLLLAALGLWTVMSIFTGQWGSGPNIINLDIALMLLLAMATVLWAAGIQDGVDGFEIGMTALVATTIWLLPTVLRIAPDSLTPWVLTLTFLAPGVTIAVTTLRDLRRNGPDLARLPQLGLTVLTYALVAALAWHIGDDAASLADNFASLTLDVLLLPLSVFLIIGASSGRRQAAPPTPPPTPPPTMPPPPVWFPPPPPGSQPVGRPADPR